VHARTEYARSGDVNIAYQVLMGGQADWTEFPLALHVPTLVLHRAGDRVVPAAEGRLFAANA
jgi:hypothetical protein